MKTAQKMMFPIMRFGNLVLGGITASQHRKPWAPPVRMKAIEKSENEQDIRANEPRDAL
jgi:hypothetical protein